MYHLAIVALLGLALWKVVGMLLGFAGQELQSHVKAFLTLGLGVVTAEVLDYSIFAAWGVSLREAWMGPVFTGLIIGGAAYVVHPIVGIFEAYGRKGRDEAREIERRARAA